MCLAMTRIRIILAALCVGLTVLWLEADRLWTDGSFTQLRLSLLNYTGIVAMGVMAVSLLLALRSTVMEPHVGGLDKELSPAQVARSHGPGDGDRPLAMGPGPVVARGGRRDGGAGARA